MIRTTHWLAEWTLDSVRMQCQWIERAIFSWNAWLRVPTDYLPTTTTRLIFVVLTSLHRSSFAAALDKAR